LRIDLTGSEYIFSTPVDISSTTFITSKNKKPIRLALKSSGSDFLFQVKAGGSLHFTNIQLDLKALTARSFVSSDTSGASNHTNFTMKNSAISNLDGTFYSAAKSNVSDSIIVRETSFSNGKGTIFNFSSETDKKGYYNVEKLVISNNSFNNHSGQILTMLRGGNDESTMGPNLLFTFNTLINCNTANREAIIYNYGTQATLFENNQFTNCNLDKTLLLFEDAVRAKHLLRNNILSSSGKIITNKYAVEVNYISR
jgi:poly(beta-D-mannuronate) lyase